MNFVTGPLVWPLERSKQRPSLRECTILLRKSMNIYGMAPMKIIRHKSTTLSISSLAAYRKFGLSKLSSSAYVNYKNPAYKNSLIRHKS